jgi:hypothetical protein
VVGWAAPWPARPWRAAALTVMVGGVVLAGCGSAPTATAEGPTVVCGVTLKGTVEFDVMTGRFPLIRHSGRSPLDFIVARGCAHGSQVRWAPRTAARLVQTVRAKDGLAKAVALAPTRTPSSFRLTVSHDGRVIGSATVRVSL